jgi:flagellar biosynthesis/type III secretory pathway protein FliH
MATLSERLREEGLKQGLEQGMQRGMQQGMQQGRLEGEATLLKRQISRRFGALDDATVKRLEMATTEELERWAENVLDARKLEDVFTQH